MSDAGEVEGAPHLHWDGDERLRLLLEASDLLGASLDSQATLSRLAQFFVPRLADWCSIDVLDETGEPKAIALAHVDPRKVALIQELRRRFPPRPSDSSGLMNVLRTGVSELHPQGTDELFGAGGAHEEHLGMVRDLGMRSALIVPLRARGRTLGAFTLVSASDWRRYDPVDQRLVEKLASRAALAIENASLYLAERLSNDRLARMQAVTAALSEARTSRRVGEVMVRQGADALGAQTAIFYTLSPGGDSLEVLAGHGVPESFELASVPVFGDGPAAASVQSAAPVWVRTEAEYLGLYPQIAAELGEARRNRAFFCVPLLLNGRVLGMLAMGFATERSFAEEERNFVLGLAGQAAQALDRAMLHEHAEQIARAREEMLAIVSHDLRNPLSVIEFNAALLLREPTDLRGERIRAKAAIMLRSSERMAHLIRDLLDASSIETGKLSITLSADEAAQVMEEAAEMARPLMVGKSITFDVDIDVEGVEIMCDRERVLQLLSNLLGNAAKFTPEGGRVRFTASTADDALRIDVADTGPGVSEEHLPHIFDRYWQAARVARAGVGLGLYISRGIALAHGGNISVETRAGRGSTFHVLLPLSGRARARRSSLP